MIKFYIKKKTPTDIGIGIFDNFKKILVELVFVGLIVNFKTKGNPYNKIFFAVGVPGWKSFWIVIASEEWFKYEEYRKNAIEYGHCA
jgi:hypothetical protein